MYDIFNITLCVTGVISILLNGFVICRILYKNIKTLHHSKLYYFSLAIADLIFGLSCFIRSLWFLSVITVDYEVFGSWWMIAVPTSVICSLFHVIVITIDRFIALKFPLIHQRKITRVKVIISIIVLWVISFAVIAPIFWGYHHVILVAVAIGGVGGSCILSIIYIYIAVIAIWRVMLCFSVNAEYYSQPNHLHYC